MVRAATVTRGAMGAHARTDEEMCEDLGNAATDTELRTTTGQASRRPRRVERTEKVGAARLEHGRERVPTCPSFPRFDPSWRRRRRDSTGYRADLSKPHMDEKSRVGARRAAAPPHAQPAHVDRAGGTCAGPRGRREGSESAVAVAPSRVRTPVVRRRPGDPTLVRRVVRREHERRVPGPRRREPREDVHDHRTRSKRVPTRLLHRRRRSPCDSCPAVDEPPTSPTRTRTDLPRSVRHGRDRVRARAILRANATPRDD